jgi:Protein of unknown function (DUF2752)
VDRASRLRLLALAAAVASVLPRAALTHGPIICPIRRITGYPCPACGMVRSWHSTLQLRPMRALTDHPFGPIALGAIVAEASRPGSVERGMQRARGLPAAVQAGAVLAWLGWWISRLLAARRGR